MANLDHVGYDAGNFGEFSHARLDCAEPAQRRDASAALAAHAQQLADVQAVSHACMCVCCCRYCLPVQYSSVIPSLAGAGVDSRYTGDNVVGGCGYRVELG